MDVDSFGIIYIVDTQNNSIRKGVPGFICPANISVTALAGQNTIPVTYSAPTAIPGMTVTCTPPSGADFSEGTTIVTCTAVSQTNSVTCTFTVTVIVPPTITIQPESIDVTAGQTLGLSVLASGSSPLFYAWLFEGVTIPGATNSSLVISNAQSVNEGVYQAMITNNGGSVD